MYRISALTSEYNLTSDIIFNLLKDSMEELKEIELTKTKTNNTFGVQQKIEIKNTKDIKIKGSGIKINILNQAVHFFSEGVNDKDVVKYIFEKLYEVNIFDRFGVEKTQKIDVELMLGTLNIKGYLGDLRKTEVKNIEHSNYNKISSYKNSNDGVYKVIEYNTIYGVENLNKFIECLDKILEDIDEQ